MSFEDLAPYDLPLSAVEASVTQWVNEALELRHGGAGDAAGSINGQDAETIDQITDLLIRVRSRSDRVDELLANVTRAKARSKRIKDEAAFVADLRLLEATQTRASQRVDFESAREREADAKLVSIEERRAEHRATKLVSITTEAYDVINQIHWQLDAIRKDLRARLHALQFESSLER